MKDLILKHLKEHNIKLSFVYDDKGNKIDIKDMVKGKCYFINKESTLSERGMNSFKKAMGYTEAKKETVSASKNKTVKKG